MTLLLLIVALAAPEPAPLPELWSVEAAAPAPVSADPWWQSWDDPALSAAMQDAFDGNFDLAAAVGRAEQARGLAQQALSPLLPNITADGSFQTAPLNTLGFQFGGLGPQDPNAPKLYWLGSALLSAQLNLDVFGRDVLNAQAAQRDRRAAEANLDEAAVALASAIATGWYDVALHHERLRLLEAQVEANRTVLELTELRFQHSEATTVELLQQRQNLASTEALLPSARAALTIAQQQTAVLLGRAPSNAPPGMPTRLPDPPALPSLGSPSDLLLHRPDLRAGAERADAARQRRLAAERGFLPSFGVQGSAGWQLFNAGQFREVLGWNIGVNASIPIFDAGRAIASLKQARATEHIEVATWRSSTLAAAQQVEAALARDTEQRDRLVSLRAQTQAAKSAFDTSRRRYAEGVEAYLPTLTALVAWQSAELNLLQARRDAIDARVRLHEALGGPWTRKLHAAGDPR